MENDLRNLGRMELLQVLLRVTESNEALMTENAELKAASSMQISRSAKVGSIAEEALRVNGFFEAAQHSADDYLREIMKLRDEMIEHSKAQAAAQASRGALGISEEDRREQLQLFERIQDQAKIYIQDVQTYANNVMARANTQAQSIVDDARSRSDEIIAQANARARIIVEEAEARAGLKVASPAEEPATEEALEDVSTEPEIPTEESETVAFRAEELEVAEVQVEEPDVEESVAEEPVADEPEASVSAMEEMTDETLGGEELAPEMAATEASPDEVKQNTAPLNIDVIVSDIAATAFSEGELDPNSTGALVRRGRHVKLPEGMAM